MAISLGRNIPALRAERNISQTSNALQRVFERLSSGSRINRPSDDAAGLSVSSALKVSTRIFTRGVRNVNDGISAINIADGTLQNLSTVTIRQRELAAQAANGTLSVAQRQALNTEANQLVDEFNRLLDTTRLNGLGLLAGRFGELRIQGGVGIDGGIGFLIGGELERGVGNGTYTFSGLPSASYDNNGTTLGGVELVDLNGDSILDMISASGNAGATTGIDVRLGNGDGTFGSVTVAFSSANSTYSGLVAGDFNSDGKADVAFTRSNFTDSESRLYVAYGNGSGGFSSSSLISTVDVFSPFTPVEAGDIDGDGRLDLVTSTGTSIQVFRNSSTGFSLARNITGSTQAGSSLKLGDMDGDGRIDIVSKASASTFRVITNSGNFNFSLGSSISAGGNFTTLAVGDINRDGYGDVITDSANTASTLARVLIGNSAGTFTQSTVTGTGQSNGIQLADLNGDGNLDFMAVNSAGSEYYALVGNGAGSFSNQSTYSYAFPTSGNAAFGLGDLNGDGSIDLVTNAMYFGKMTHRIVLQGATQVTSAQYLNLSTAAGAREAMGILDDVLQRIALERGSLGAVVSRLNTFAELLKAQGVAYQEAEARISDADMAQETANLTRIQILQNAGASVMAQAVAQPEIALTLLQGI